MEDQIIIEWILSLSVAICAALLVVFASSSSGDVSVMGGRTAKKRQWGLLLRLGSPFIVPVGNVIQNMPIQGYLQRTEKALRAAGAPAGLSAGEFHALKIVGLLFGVFGGMFIDSELDMSPVFVVVLSVLGIWYPGIYLRGLIQKRCCRVFRDLPDMLDTLRLAVEAGLDLSSAMTVVVEKGKTGPLREELECVERDMRLGRSRREAFKSMADRLDMSEMSALVLALNQADQLGASIGPILKVQAEMGRSRRWQYAETLVNKMPMKMMGPLIIFIFPASFIILFTPLFIQWMQSN